MRAIKIVDRNSALAALIKEYRGNKCQICNTAIKRADGGYYVEAHHLEQLSNGGIDFSKNVIVVCPNCHKTCHVGDIEKVIHDANHVVLRINEKTLDIPLTSTSGVWIAKNV